MKKKGPAHSRPALLGVGGANSCYLLLSVNLAISAHIPMNAITKMIEIVNVFIMFIFMSFSLFY